MAKLSAPPPIDTTDYTTNGEAIRALRQRLGVSQKTLCRMLNLGPNTVWRWENDINPESQPLAYWAVRGLLAAVEKGEHP